MRPRASIGPLLALCLLVATPPLAAQPRPAPPPAATAPAPAAAPPVEEAAPDSPRASVKRFLELCKAGEYAEAAAYLDLTEVQKPDGAQLARRLKAVLDRQIWIKLESISPLPQGDPLDKLPAGVEEIGSIPGPGGAEPVRLVRRHFPEGTRWLFSRTTVERIDDWYSRLRDRWLQEYMPQILLRAGPEDLLWWQWIALPVLFLLALGAGNVLGYLTRLVIGRVVARTKTTFDDHLLKRLGGPLTLVWAVAAVDLALPHIALYPPAEAFMARVLRAGFFLGVFWFVERGIDVVGARVLTLPTTKGNSAARSLVPLGARALKVALVAVAIVATLSVLGYPVGSLVAGLGIGGVAIALAAQKTMENLFGSLSIGVDQPFRVGDFITVDGLSGSVESIGLRSTRIRTLDRTLVTIPNGKLADMRIESFAERDRIRFACTLNLDRGCAAAEVRAVVTGARALLEKHPKIWPGVSVSMAKIGDASLDVEILAWFQTTSWNEFLVLREDTLLGLLEVVEKAQARLAAAPVPRPVVKP
jgi:MscS family membrane protein